MTLLDGIVRAFRNLVLDVLTQDLLYRSRVGFVAVGDNSLWNGLQQAVGLLEKGLGCRHVPVLTEHDIYKIALFVDTPIEIASTLTYLYTCYACFINELGAADFVPSFLTQAIGEVGAESIRPIPHRFMADGEASNQKHFGNVAMAELEPVPEVDHLENDVGGQLDKIPGGARPLVEGFPTTPAPVNGVAQSCRALELGGAFGLAMRAAHSLM